MDRAQIESELRREPFVPFRLHLADGRSLDVPFRHVIVFQELSLIIFKGVKEEGRRVATSYEHLPYDRIERIGHRRRRAGGGRKKAG